MLLTVTAASAFEAVALHNALEALAFRDARNFDDITDFENLRERNLVPRFRVLVDLLLAHFFQVPEELSCALQVPLYRFRDVLFFRFSKTELYGIVSVFFQSLYVRDGHGTGNDNGRRENIPLSVEDLGHALFYAECEFHRVFFAKRRER